MDKSLGKAVETSETNKQETQEFNDFTKNKIQEFVAYKFKDDNLWEAFKDEFGHFKEADFKKISISLQRLLQQHLISHGVRVEWDKDRRIKIAK